MKFPTYEEMGQEVANRVLNEYEYKGKTLRQWIEIISATELGTNLAEVGTDCISREQAIEIIEDYPHGDWNVDTMSDMVGKIKQLPPIQPKRETATVSVGMSKGGVTMWYECEACGEPVDQGDTFCSGCGRELIHE